MITYYPNCTPCCGGILARLLYFEFVEKTTASTPANIGNTYARYRTYQFSDGTTDRTNVGLQFTFNNSYTAGEGPHRLIATARDANNVISECKLIFCGTTAQTYTENGVQYHVSAANHFDTITDYSGAHSYTGIVLCTLSGGIETLYYSPQNSPVTAVILEPV